MFRHMFVMAPEGAGNAGAGSGGAASTAGGNPAAATTAGTGGGGVSGSGSSSSSTTTNSQWYSGLSDPADRGFVENKGYPDLAAMVKSHRNLEGLMGVPKERLLKLPEKSDAPEWAEIFSKLGKPEKADEYGMPKGSPEEFTKWARETFHGLNLTKAQGEALASKITEMVAQGKQASEDAFVRESHAQLENLKKEWGAAYQSNVDAIDKLATQLGISKEHYEAMERTMGVDGFAKFLFALPQKFGAKMGESNFVHGGSEGGSGFNVMTPGAAQEQINRLMNDKSWFKKYMDGDVEARDLWTHLNKMAVGAAGAA